uniref:CD79a molecule, immunoglobulin-associated alpha n=1 Tax=Neogobius melanostomus TaxID=47308 RepID=A0A8C6TE38_9GOBI
MTTLKKKRLRGCSGNIFYANEGIVIQVNQACVLLRREARWFERATPCGFNTTVRKMERLVILLFCSSYVLSVQCVVTLQADCPSIKVEVSRSAVLECCFTNGKENFVWIKTSQHANKTMETHIVQDAEIDERSDEEIQCGILTLSHAKQEDTGFYRCYLNISKVVTHGTYLQVYKPLEKTINLSESVKNGILTAEGILLLLCVMLPSASLLFKSKRLNDLEKKKVTREEENIYQGLNLDECCAGYEYDQIERLQGSYEDVVGNNEEDFQLEKP